MQLRLCDEDRERFGTAEWLTLDLRAISVADLEELSDRFGFDPSDWPEPFMGRLTLEQAGDPDAKPRPPRWRDRALAWMLLRQNGVAVDWEDAGSVRALLIEVRGDKAPSPGKDDTEETPSPPSEVSTIPPSDTSTDSPQAT